MRIVITNLGKVEIIDDDNNFSEGNNYQNGNVFRNISVPYNRININMNSKGINTSRKFISIPKLRYNKFPTINKTNQNSYKNIFNEKKTDTSILPKINDSMSPKKQSTMLNNSQRIFKKAIIINQKKLNIPSKMFDKYSFKGNNNTNEEEVKVNNTENNVFNERNKMYPLRDILLPKNQKNLDESFLDKNINTNGGMSIINYLQKDKIISPIYIQKVTQLKNGELSKMDKICQKYLKDEIQKNKMDTFIRKKIKIGYEREAINYEKDLKTMNNKLMNYNTIYQRLRLKKENYDNYKLMYLSTMK
jgi:hypothetical protein